MGNDVNDIHTETLRDVENHITGDASHLLEIRRNTGHIRNMVIPEYMFPKNSNFNPAEYGERRSTSSGG